MNRLDKFNVEFLGPRNIEGVSVIPSGFHYKLSNLYNLKYLDLADSKVTVRKIHWCPRNTGILSYYRTFVRCELREIEMNVTFSLFKLYTKRILNSTLGVQLTFRGVLNVVYKYLRVFNLFGMYDYYETSRATVMSLIKFLNDNNIDCPHLVKDIAYSIFKSPHTVFCFLTAPEASNCFISIAYSMEKKVILNLLSTAFQISNVCPMLGMIFTENPDMLSMLLSLRIKKREFCNILMPLHQSLLNIRIYAAFKPIGVMFLKVRLNQEVFTTRDHLVFEIIAVLASQQIMPENTGFMRFSLSLINRTLPYPYISLAEMRSRLSRIIPPIDEQDIDTAISAYNQYFPDVPKETCPRSLQDLCRCSIWNSLNMKYDTREALEQLALPEKIISYLSFETK